MKRFLSHVRTQLVVAAVLVTALIAFAPNLSAQVTVRTDANAPKVPPRLFNEQMVHYIRGTITFNMCTQSSNACAVKLLSGALPYNAIVLRANVVTYTAFNSTTSDVVTIGTSSANANEIVSSGVSTHATGLAAGTLVSNIQAATGGTTTQTGDDGGFDVWVKWTAGTGNTATTGLASVILEYIAPNDGLCTNAPLGSAPAGC